jgi:YVTN family beta-propeller protein
MTVTLALIGALTALPRPAAAGGSFVNWESPHVHPMDVTPDGTRLLAVNTADNRLEVFAIDGGSIAHEASIPVGLDPVSVRARTASEAWVVNHVSDSVSVIDLDAGAVVATVLTGDEPADVVFAGRPLRAFVSVSQLNRLEVLDPANLAAPPVFVAIAGEDPRALATDGTRVFAAIFESGNGTTVLDENVVSSPVNPYPGDPNPPPNAGSAFDPPIADDLPLPPPASLIVKKDSAGVWRDVNGTSWSAAVPWNLHGHDVAVVDAASLAVTYVNGVMNLNMAMTVAPSGDVYVVGTDAINEVRFEPNVRGIFVRVKGARFTPPAAGPGALVDLNPHLDYSVATMSQDVRDESIGDPRGVAVNDAGDRVYVAGMGSNNLVVLDAAMSRIALVEVGEGPTGVAVNGAEGVVYVLDKFEGAISIVDASSLVETQRVAFHDPTPAAIRDGRPFLYDTHRTSGLGQASCASCHVDGRMDQLAWDLGNPQGEMKEFNQVCNFGFGGCEDWHPMKGPMTTQTLMGIMSTEPFHWRGDREDLAAFNGAFEALMADDVQLAPEEMAQFEAFVATLTPPPNPNRNLNGTLRTTLPGVGSPTQGSTLFNTVLLDGGLLTCAACHALPAGTNGQITSANLIQESQSMKIPQLRNLYEKTGFSQTSAANNRGFGFIHDGSVDSIFSFLQFDGFNFTSDTQRRNVEAFLLSFATDTHAGVGAQATIGGSAPNSVARRDELVTIAGGGAVGLVAKGVVGGELRGYALVSGMFQSDRSAEIVSLAALDAAAGPDAAITFTLVPAGAQTRIGIDRDEDGHLDRDELDACEDPADPMSFPGDGTAGVCACAGDVDGDGQVGFADLLAVLSEWGPCAECAADTDGSGEVDFGDLLMVLSEWGSC